MNSPVKVEFLTRTVPASDRTVAGRREVVQGLDELGHVEASVGEVNTTEREWIARIGGTDLPLLDWSVQKLDDGKVAVSLVAVVDAVTAGDPKLTQTQPVGLDENDAEEHAEARNRMVMDRLEFAERAQHDHTLTKWTCGCDPVLLGIQDAMAKTGNIDLRVVQA
jgi:hypothetical protein